MARPEDGGRASLHSFVGLLLPQTECDRGHAFFYDILCQAVRRYFTVFFENFSFKTIIPLPIADYGCVRNKIIFQKPAYFLRIFFPFHTGPGLSKIAPNLLSTKEVLLTLIICRMRITCEFEVSIFWSSDALSATRRY